MRITRRDAIIGVGTTGVAGRLFHPSGMAPGVPPAVQTIVDIIPHAGSFAGGAGSANDVIATMSVVLSPPSPPFTGAFSVTTGSASSFTIGASSGVLAVGATDLAVGAYNFNVVADQPGLAGSPFVQPFVATGSSSSITMVAGSPYPFVSHGGVGPFGAFRVEPTTTSSGSVRAITGTVTFSMYFWANGTPGGTIKGVWYLDENPISGQFTDSSVDKFITLNFDTTTVADGSHYVWIKFIDWTADSAYKLNAYGLPIIIGNTTGFGTGAQTVAAGQPRGRIHVPRPDYIAYSGTPNPAVTARPLPNPVIAGSNSESLRSLTNWVLDAPVEKRFGEYTGNPYWATTKSGGVAVVELDVLGPSTVNPFIMEQVSRENGMDGQRLNAQVTPYVTYVESTYGPRPRWYGADLAGRLFYIAMDGEAVTVHGWKRDRSKLPWDFYDTSLTEAQRNSKRIYVGTTPGAPPGFPGDTYDLQGAVDLCFDPRDSQVIYVCSQLTHTIFKVNRISGVMTVYAGAWKTPGFVNAAGTGAINARFNEPTSMIMSDGTNLATAGPAGTMYIADSKNGCIRKISPDGLTVTTLVGKQPTATEAQQGGTATYTPTSITWTSAAGGTATVTMPAATIVALGQTIFLSGATSAGGTGRINGQFIVNGFTNSQLFTLAMPGTGLDATLGGSKTLKAYQGYQYSPGPGVTVPFVDAYTVYPQVIRFTSNNNIVLGESWTLSVRLINLAASTITHIAYPSGAEHLEPPIGPTLGAWMWIAVDRMGFCGPVDDIVLMPSLFTSHYSWRFSIDGSYNTIFGNDGGGAAAFGPADIGPSGGLTGGQGHYPWAVEFSHREGRMITSGFAQGAPAMWRIKLPADPDFDVNPTVISAGWHMNRYGTVPTFPFNSRPALWAIWGEMGNSHLGPLSGGYTTWDDFGALSDAALAAYIQAGMGGSVPRPEITGNDLRDLIYYIRRNTLAGCTAPIVQPGPNDPDTTAPIVLSLSATRLSATSIRVDFTTNEPAICVAGAGSPAQQAFAFCKYPVFSAIETGFSTTHSITIINIPSGTAHYTVLVKDVAGNVAYIADQTVAP